VQVEAKSEQTKVSNTPPIGSQSGVDSSLKPLSQGFGAVSLVVNADQEN
jgi:hypothetical protein